ncbi:MAG: hypothetical protein QW098_04675 [Candidatus Hadarchaeales archaeon]
MSPRCPLALFSAFLGSLLLLEASTPSPSSFADLSLLCLGAALLLSGFLLADHLLHASSPALLGLGVSLLLHRGEKDFSGTTRTLFLVLALLLFLLAVLLPLLSHRLLRPRK